MVFHQPTDPIAKRLAAVAWVQNRIESAWAPTVRPSHSGTGLFNADGLDHTGGSGLVADVDSLFSPVAGSSGERENRNHCTAEGTSGERSVCEVQDSRRMRLAKPCCTEPSRSHETHPSFPLADGAGLRRAGVGRRVDPAAVGEGLLADRAVRITGVDTWAGHIVPEQQFQYKQIHPGN